MTVRGATPAAKSSDAHPWRVSCKRTCGRPADAAIRRNDRYRFRGSIGLPLRVVKT